MPPERQQAQPIGRTQHPLDLRDVPFELFEQAGQARTRVEKKRHVDWNGLVGQPVDALPHTVVEDLEVGSLQAIHGNVAAPHRHVDRHEIRLGPEDGPLLRARHGRLAAQEAGNGECHECGEALHSAPCHLMASRSWSSKPGKRRKSP